MAIKKPKASLLPPFQVIRTLEQVLGTPWALISAPVDYRKKEASEIVNPHHRYLAILALRRFANCSYGWFEDNLAKDRKNIYRTTAYATSLIDKKHENYSEEADKLWGEISMIINLQRRRHVVRPKPLEHYRKKVIPDYGLWPEVANKYQREIDKIIFEARVKQEQVFDKAQEKIARVHKRYDKELMRMVRIRNPYERMVWLKKQKDNYFESLTKSDPEQTGDDTSQTDP
jgi:hypothetical protein